MTPQNALHLTPFHFQSFKVSKIDSKYVSLVLTGPLGLPQVFNQALRRQCACVGFVQSGTVSKVNQTYNLQTYNSAHLFDTLVTGMDWTG